MMRLFAGISLPESHRRAIHLLQGGILGARWTALENYHITLTFMGDVDEATAADIDDALSSVHADGFDLRLHGTDAFAQGDDPKVLWVGMDHSDALHRLKEKIDSALKSRHIRFETRKYIPHVTLARFRHPDDDKIGEFMQTHNLFALPPFAVDKFILYRTHQTKNGHYYEEAAEYPLGFKRL
jgi:2'-5' RNA ligase